MNANSAQTNPTEQEDSASARLRATQNLLREALKEFRPGSIALSFSGAEDVVLIDLIRKLGRTIDVFSLDTGRLHSETYEFFETIRKQYDQPIELLNPDPEGVQNLVKAKGLFSFYEDGHQECCGVRKVQPLRKKLATLDAWITGQRQDQSVTRSNVPLRQYDEAFSTDENDLTKFNPLAQWTSADIWHYIRETECPTIHYTTEALFPSAANPAPAQSAHSNTSGLGAGGGKKQRRRNAACMDRTSFPSRRSDSLSVCVELTNRQFYIREKRFAFCARCAFLRLPYGS